MQFETASCFRRGRPCPVQQPYLHALNKDLAPFQLTCIPLICRRTSMLFQAARRAAAKYSALPHCMCACACLYSPTCPPLIPCALPPHVCVCVCICILGTLISHNAYVCVCVYLHSRDTHIPQCLWATQQGTTRARATRGPAKGVWLGVWLRGLLVCTRPSSTVGLLGVCGWVCGCVACSCAPALAAPLGC